MTLFSCLPGARWGDVGHLGSASPNKIAANKASSDNNYYDKQLALCYPNILGTRHDIGAAPQLLGPAEEMVIHTVCSQIALSEATLLPS